MFRRFITVLVCAVPALIVSLTAVPSAEGAAVKVIRWKDGDSLITSVGEVRLIGVDTPEQGTCGSASAKALANRLAPAGSFITLPNPTSVKNKDRYGRLLRYVNRGKVDIGYRQIRAGARARYDSRDGYQWHPRQRSYRTADAQVANYKCATGASTAPSGRDCPSNAPIKGNQGSNGWIYHRPGQEYYPQTVPEQCFATESQAQAAGYRPAKV